MTTHAYHIREAVPADAEAIISYMKTLADEPDNGTTFSSADEFVYTPEQERQQLSDWAAAENAQCVVAEAAGQLVGLALVQGGVRSNRHTVTLAISVAQAWRNQGLGRALLQNLIAWCAANPTVHRLQLQVQHNNARAIHLYEALGFVHEGVAREAAKKHGHFIDILTMGMLFPQNRG